LTGLIKIYNMYVFEYHLLKVWFFLFDLIKVKEFICEMRRLIWLL